jgi:single-stranded-DNA-specific exonuclease
MKTIWEINHHYDETEALKLAKELNVMPIIGKLLAQRGIHTYEEAKHFFRPTIDHLHNPFLMKGMTPAIERIEKAIANSERILFFGDYDVDGTTAVSLLYSFFKQFYSNVDYYIPDRYTEGYGISIQGIDYAKKTNVSLIIALDCGIKAIEQVAYANKKNIDFIICDHHLPGENLPKAVAILDPKQSDCTYPYKELSGCGIGFKLAQAFCEQNKHDIQTYLLPFIDLVAVSIGCDIVPIDGENRVLAYLGLKKINANPTIAFKVLFEIAELKKEKTITDLVFVLGPRINAAGRMNHGRMAVELMTTKKESEIEKLCAQINEHNLDRRSLDKDITAEALKQIESSKKLREAKATVVYNETWHKGVIGIVASRLIETYYKPTIVLTLSNGMITGSARSVSDFDINEAIAQCGELLDKYGGHKFAAGLTLKPENLTKFQEKFEQVVASTITKEQQTPKISIDAEVSFQDITPKFFRLIEQFAPFGPSNMRPTLMTKNVVDYQNGSKSVGEEQIHLKVVVSEQQNQQVYFSGIGFNLAHHLPHIKTEKPFDIAYHLEENEWNERKTIQLRVKDIRA